MSFHSVKADCPGLKTPQTHSCHQPSPRTKQSVHTSTAQPHRAGLAPSPETLAYNGGTKKMRKIPRKRALNACSWWRTGKWEKNLPEHTSFLILNTRGEKERCCWVCPSVCLGLCVVAPVQYVCLPLRPLGWCPTSSVWTWLSAVSLTFCASLFPSHVEPWCTSAAPEQQNHKVNAAGTWKLHTRSKHGEQRDTTCPGTGVWTGNPHLLEWIPACFGTRMGRERETDRLDLCHISDVGS